MNEELAGMVGALADRRAAAVAARVELDRLTSEFEARDDVKEARSTLATLRAEGAVLETAIKEWGTVQLANDPLWKPEHPAIGVRMMTDVKLAAEEALAWAETNMPVAIKRVLDEKMLVDYAKKNQVPWAQVRKVPTVTIATDLTPYGGGNGS